MKNKIELGKMGEKLAADFLKKKGYKILETNYRNKIGEIDIIAEFGGAVIFVEVKTRTDDRMGAPREAVTYYKQHKIRTTAEGYLKSNGLTESACRFDCVEVEGTAPNYRIEHIIGDY